MGKKSGKNFLKNVLGVSPDPYDDYDELEDEEYDMEPMNIKSKASNVVDIQSAAASLSSNSTRVFISKPMDFDEATVIVDNLKNKKIIVVNTNSIDAKVGQRLLDFISGATYALNAELQQIDKGVYLLSPANVEVDNSLKGEINKGNMFSFIK